MAWFFSDTEISGDSYIITGESAKHISKVLRMRVGEELTLITPEGEQLNCEVQSINSASVAVRVMSRKHCENEPNVFVTLYQALPKGDKMDYIIQKCTELGVSRIVPVISARCVSRPDEKSLAKKRERWQKIALQAAMQSRRGIIPEVCECVSFKKACKLTSENDKTVIFYELGGEHIDNILSAEDKKIGMFIGSEGGFEPEEVKSITSMGASTATLGKRILRAETAPLAALSIIMYETGNF